jgi:glucose/arabinose dehydrogenase
VRLLGVVAIAATLAGQTFGQAQRSPTPAVVAAPIRAVVVASGLDHPWGLVFLSDGAMLVTERTGRLRRVDRDGRVSEPLAGVPKAFVRGQGGLLDVALSPGFARDRLVYLSYAEPGDDGAGTAVARARLGEGGLSDLQVIWRQVPKVNGPNHWGSRLVFARDGTLFITTGDRFAYRERAQDLSTTLGKIVRINADGSIPQDNPFVKRDGARPEIWSYGHRNVQAAALDPDTGQLWTVEHGARGGDEPTIRKPGRTTAGRSSPTASTIRGRESAKARRSPDWSSRSTTGTR